MTHPKPFPHADRSEEIKKQLREKLQADERAREEKVKRDEEEKIAAEKKKEEEAKKALEEKAARKAARPWRTAQFVERVARSAKRQNEDASNQNHPDQNKDDAVEKGLEAIYMGRDGEVPDLSTLERKPRRVWVRAIGGLMMVAALFVILAWAGKQWFPSLPWQHAPGLKMEMAGPDTIALGKEERFAIQWKNEAPVSLARAAIRVGLPADFISTGFEPDPTDRERLEWNLGELFPNASGTIVVKGVFAGALGSKQAIQMIGDYQRKDANREEETLATFAVSYERSLIVGEMSAPANVIAGDPLSLRYDVGNQTDKAVEGMFARIVYPSGFVPSAASSTTLNAAARELTIALPRLPAQTTTTVTIAGFFSSGISDDQTFTAESGRRAADGSFQAMSRSEMRVPVSAGDLALHLIVNGAEGDRSFSTGDSLRITIAYQNTGAEALENVSLALGLESVVDGVSATGTSLLAWDQLEDAVGGVTSTRTRIQSIRFDKKSVPAFASLEPRTEGSLDVFLPTLALATGTRDAVIRVTLEGTVDGRGKNISRRSIAASGASLRFRTDADVATEARYFTEEGAPLGFGPLPPVVGKTTAYRIYWRLWKTLHPLEHVEVSAALPKIAAWSARSDASAGAVSYDEASRTVKWNIDRVADGEQDLEASFEVQLTPEQVDIGRFASLLGETRLMMKDPVVNESLSRKRAALTTDLENDEGARRKGVVKRE